MKHKHRFHIKRFALFGVLILGLALVRIGATSQPVMLPQVLGYASGLSQQQLLDGTNHEREAHGLPDLHLNTKLELSAQDKANDMSQKDYWSHESPDGTQPWAFMTKAGYNYQSAAENLAYGFNDSTATLHGWMGSDSHRANILGPYTEVGFGYVNAARFQGGNETIVVAHYATPSTIASSNAQSGILAKTTVNIANKQDISLFQVLRGGLFPAYAVLGLSIMAFATLGYGLTHRRAFHHALVDGERFVFSHPGIDSAIIGGTTTLVLLTTYAHIG
jgi:uncharacterized protein YkwD